MKWVDGHAVADHPREPWNTQEPPSVLVHARLDRIRGTNEGQRIDAERLQARYGQAKFGFDLDAAFEIVETNVSPEVMDQIVELAIRSEPPLRLVRPTPSFDDDDADGWGFEERGPTNALPFAYMESLRQKLGAEVDEQIVQSARVGRTKLNMFLRFLCQPSFKGNVRPNEEYVLVDDVFTTGGTLAALRSHILRRGGTVAFATTLAHKDGVTQPFAVAESTLNELRSLYGDAIDAQWLEVAGHEVERLTEPEARFLIEWGLEREGAGASRGDELLQRLRDRIDKAASTGE